MQICLLGLVCSCQGHGFGSWWGCATIHALCAVKAIKQLGNPSIEVTLKSAQMAVPAMREFLISQDPEGRGSDARWESFGMCLGGRQLLSFCH